LIEETQIPPTPAPTTEPMNGNLPSIEHSNLLQQSQGSLIENQKFRGKNYKKLRINYP